MFMCVNTNYKKSLYPFLFWKADNINLQGKCLSLQLKHIIPIMYGLE